MRPTRKFIFRCGGCLLALASLGACSGGGDASSASTSPVGSANSSGPTVPVSDEPNVGSSQVPSRSGTTTTLPAVRSGTSTTAAPVGTAPTTTLPAHTTNTIRGSVSPTTTANSTAPATTVLQLPPVAPAPPSATTTTSPPVSATTTTPPPAPTTTRPTVPATTVQATKSVTVDAADTSPPVITVAFGTAIVLTVVSVTEQEFHVHDFDITKAGTTVTFAFTADLHGTHIVESHTSGKLICTFVVG